MVSFVNLLEYMAGMVSMNTNFKGVLGFSGELMSNWPPVCEVYPNYEVLVLQTCTVPSPYIGSIAIVTSFISFPPAPPDSTLFLGHYFTSSILTPPINIRLLS